jgi:hypothetical protein
MNDFRAARVTSSLCILVAGLCLGASAPASADTYYVAPQSTDCTSTAGSGTIWDPWQNLYSALTRHTFSAGDVINLRGGTYRNNYNNFAAGCNMPGDVPGINTVLPLNMAGTNGNPIIIQNFGGETVILDGTDAGLIGATWTQCATGIWQLNTPSINVGTARTGQVWINPTSASDSGTRLAYSPITSCTGMSPGTFRFDSNGTKLFVRLPDSSNANLADLRLSCEAGDCATYPVNDGPNANFTTVRKNPAGGAFWVKYGYYAIRVDNNAQNLTFDGLDILAAGGRDYGSCVRVYKGNSITFKNGTCRETAGEGMQLYGGGPGGSNGGGIQLTNNVIQNWNVSYTGFAWIDGGGLGNNLGMGVIIKNCSNCGLLHSTVRTAFASCVEVTTSTDAGEADGVVIDGNDLSDCGYINSSAGGRTRACIEVGPQRSVANGAVRNGIYANNSCHNDVYGNGSTLNVAFAGGTVNGISMSDAGWTAMSGNIIVNNSIDSFSGPGLNLLEVNQPVTFRNNVFGGHLATGGNVCNGNGACDVMLSPTPTVHSNNAYWADSDSTQVIFINGVAAFTRATATDFEPSAIQRDPLFVSASSLKLQAQSPLIDAGTALGCPQTDAIGVSRPRGAACDVGAFESVGVVPVPATPANLRIIRK